MNIVPRSAWRARPPKWVTRMGSSQGMFLHYNGPAVPGQVVQGDREALYGWLRNIQRFHMDRNGWPDIAYSFCVANDGPAGAVAIELRGWGVVGAHTVGWNHRAHAIVFPVGGDQPITDAQVAVANQLLAEHDRRYGPGFIRGHKQAPNATSCPGGPVMAAIQAGRFQPAPNPDFPDPEDKEMRFVVVDPRLGRGVWLCSGVSRRRLNTPEEVNAQLFMGARKVEATSPGAADGVLAFIRSFTDIGR